MQAPIAHSSTVISIDTLMTWLDRELEPDKFSDYCPNGLQVQGRTRISHVVTGVTASLALIEKARELQADAILVHHGWFWRNEDPTIRATRYLRIREILAAGINLIAYHLPLDAHPVLGNNAQLARQLDLLALMNADGSPVTCGPGGLIWLGHSIHQSLTVNELAQVIETRLQRKPIYIGDPDAPAGKVAWCTGGAQNMFEAAIAAGANTYITGEISEPSAHLARESGATFISAGHHATERYGIQALGQALHEALGIKVTFVEIDNPA